MSSDVERQSSPNMGLLQTKSIERMSRLHQIALSRFYSVFEHLLRSISVQTVLDAGSGEGYMMSKFLLNRYQHVCGIDLDFARLKYSRQQFDLPVTRGNLHHLPFPSNAFDLVVCLEVLEHVGVPNKAIAELSRVTNKYAILSVPNEPFWRISNMLRGAYWKQLGNTPEHINHWSVWGFNRFLTPYFEILNIATPITWTFVLAQKKGA